MKIDSALIEGIKEGMTGDFFNVDYHVTLENMGIISEKRIYSLAIYVDGRNWLIESQGLFVDIKIRLSESGIVI